MAEFSTVPTRTVTPTVNALAWVVKQCNHKAKTLYYQRKAVGAQDKGTVSAAKAVEAHDKALCVQLSSLLFACPLSTASLSPSLRYTETVP